MKDLDLSGAGKHNKELSNLQTIYMKECNIIIECNIIRYIYII